MKATATATAKTGMTSTDFAVRLAGYCVGNMLPVVLVCVVLMSWCSLSFVAELSCPRYGCRSMPELP